MKWESHFSITSMTFKDASHNTIGRTLRQERS